MKNRLFQYARYAYVILSICLILHSCLSLSSCSKPTKQLSPDEILVLLMDRPEVPSPPAMAANDTATGFLLTNEYSQFLDSYASSLDNWISDVIEEEIVPTKSGNTFEWEIIKPYGVWNLTVIRADTIEYRLDQVSGEGVGSWYFRGWVYRSNNTARFQWTDDYIEWLKDSFGRTVKAYIFSRRYTVNDTTNGGGYLSVNNIPLQIMVFEASWDTEGHGTYSGIHGSGHW
jgi:hypothetical protein